MGETEDRRDHSKLFKVGALVGSFWAGEIPLWDSPPAYPIYEDFPVAKLEAPVVGVVLAVDDCCCKVFIDKKVGWIDKNDLRVVQSIA